MPGGRIVVTGAAGKLGRLLAPLLGERFPLRLCDIAPVTAAPGDEGLQGDLSDPAFARRAVAGAAGVVHLAGLVASRVSFEDTLDPNYRAVLALLEACRLEGVPRFVFASSHHIVGALPADRQYDESAPIEPDSYYGLAKAFGEAACAMFARRYGVRTLVIRIGNGDPEVADARRERLWISGRDLAQLVDIGLTAPGLTYEVVYGVSECPNALFANDAARRLGYRPLDRAGQHRSPAFDAETRWSAIGGVFMADELPAPFHGTR